MARERPRTQEPDRESGHLFKAAGFAARGICRLEVRQPNATGTAKNSQPPTRFDELNMSAIEKQAILQALEKTGGNRLKAAQLLGIGLRTLQTKLKEYGMTER